VGALSVWHHGLMSGNAISSKFFAHVRIRSENISRKDIYFIAAMGAIIALLFLPIFNNLEVPVILAAHGIGLPWAAMVFVLIAHSDF